MKKVTHNGLTLLLLAVIFLCPGIAAWEFYQHPEWLRAKALNRGQLLNPPEHFAALNQRHKWQLILWIPGDCRKACLQQIETLARIRLALGRRLYQVDELLVMNQRTERFSDALLEQLKEKDIRVLFFAGTPWQKPRSFTDRSGVFIAAPDDYLVLAYAMDVSPQDIFHDIEQLLKVAGKKSG